MKRISLTDLAKNEPLEPLLEKEVQVRAYELACSFGGQPLDFIEQ